jgi:hypothetical protein
MPELKGSRKVGPAWDLGMEAMMAATAVVEAARISAQELLVLMLPEQGRRASQFSCRITGT